MDNEFSMDASLPFGPPINTDIVYYQAFFFFFFSYAMLVMHGLWEKIAVTNDNELMQSKSMYHSRRQMGTKHKHHGRTSIRVDSHTFTLTNNFLRWTYFGPTRFIQPWATLIHATLRVSDVIDKCNCWLADVTFDWRHVMVTAIEPNNQARLIITFRRRLFARYK